MSWTVILALAVGAYAFKAGGMFGLARLADGPRARALGALLPPALLSALVVVQGFSTGTDLVLDARAAGIAAGIVAAWRNLPFWAVIVIAAGTTAVVRLV